MIAAEDYLESKDSDAVESIVSHLLCTILMNNATQFVANIIDQGLLREQEGEEYFEVIEHARRSTVASSKTAP